MALVVSVPEEKQIGVKVARAIHSVRFDIPAGDEDELPIGFTLAVDHAKELFLALAEALGSLPLFVNAETGVLHRTDCHAARHVWEQTTKSYHRNPAGISERWNERHEIRDPSEGWTSECRVCRPNIYT